MIAHYLTLRELGFTHAQARALVDAGFGVVGWRVVV